MIAGTFHKGSGLGNQLFRYVATRVIALDRGYRFGMVNPENFKGISFMELDLGVKVVGIKREFFEKKVVENGVDIRGYDPEVNFIQDHTLIDGEFQDERYFIHRLNEVRNWVKVEPLDMPSDLCIIGFRGGEYALYPDLFLTADYWEQAMDMMRRHNSNIRFRVVTDDPALANQCFPGIGVTHEIGKDWRSVRYAKNLIIANSSFYILPALLNENVEKIIAPRYWARRNTETWALPQNYYAKFTYI